jgi:signal transduction histidine kinase
MVLREPFVRPGGWTRARSLFFLALLVVSIVNSERGSWLTPRGLVVGLGLVGVVVGWLGWALFPTDSGGPADPGGPADLGAPHVLGAGSVLGGPCARRLCTDTARARAGVALMGVAGVALIIAHSVPVAWVIPPVAALTAGRRLRPAYAIGLTAALAALLAAVGALAGLTLNGLAIGVIALPVALLLGVARRQTDELRQKTLLTERERARAEVLAERSRLARDVHDVLAHALGALTVQLETADALLEAGRSEQARGSVRRAGQLARDGMAETRRAIGALRGETVPWQQMIMELAGAYEGGARVAIEPDAPELPAEVGLALYRTAQEALTNVRKHAPGAPVDIAVEHVPGELTLSVVNGPAAASAPRPLAAAGGGYGLAGLRERAELAGGSFSAGPADRGWRVDVRIPS